MPSSAVRTFTEPDDYAAAIRYSTTEITVTGRGQFAAKFIRVDLHRLSLQRFSENLPRIAHSATRSERAIISFATELGPPLSAGGAEMHPGTIVKHTRREEYHQSSSGSARFGTVALPVDSLVAVGEAMAKVDLTPPPDASLVTPSPSRMTRLQRLHAAVAQLAEDTPEIIAQPEAARGIEQTLIEAMVECLTSCEPRKNGLAQAQHAVVMRRFRRVVEENLEHPLYIPEICQAIGVSNRTLQACCHEHLGMGPKHYLLLRRMHLARRALRQEAADTVSVTEIATRYGFWQLGRFAVTYQSLFGEPPSATLGRQFT